MPTPTIIRHAVTPDGFATVTTVMDAHGLTAHFHLYASQSDGRTYLVESVPFSNEYGAVKAWADSVADAWRAERFAS